MMKAFKLLYLLETFRSDIPSLESSLVWSVNYRQLNRFETLDLPHRMSSVASKVIKDLSQKLMILFWTLCASPQQLLL